MFMGITAEGINRESAASLESNALCRDSGFKALAIPETCILKIASYLPKSAKPQKRKPDAFSNGNGTRDIECRPSVVDIARGILSSLRHIVQKERNAPTALTVSSHKPEEESNRAFHERDRAPDGIHVRFGTDYYLCMLCDVELSNMYYRCWGCEKLLGQDFNICALCYEEGVHKNFLSMRPTEHKQDSSRHHVGAPKRKCSCTVAKANACEYCDRNMVCCCCTCHTVFSKRRRLYSEKDLDDMVDRAENLVDNNYVEFATETENRLNHIIMAAEEG
jgi:hypothetical protein